MAKKSVTARNDKRQKIVQKYAAVRAKLKAVISNRSSSPDAIHEAGMQLHMLPRDSSPTRLCNRCEITGRKRAYYRKFKVSRIVLRELASSGSLPGVTKASW